MKKALITGINGQDGSYLSELLLSKGYNVIEVWESEWDRGKKAIVNIQNLWRSARLKCPTV